MFDKSRIDKTICDEIDFVADAVASEIIDDYEGTNFFNGYLDCAKDFELITSKQHQHYHDALINKIYAKRRNAK
ncbi:MAG: hypothetical protein LUG99_22720 [Lachnospiraceae bacterium]|nr:hypothetical protein [Lachnospiraceae bacterium]